VREDGRQVGNCRALSRDALPDELLPAGYNIAPSPPDLSSDRARYSRPQVGCMHWGVWSASARPARVRSAPPSTPDANNLKRAAYGRCHWTNAVWYKSRYYEWHKPDKGQGTVPLQYGRPDDVRTQRPVGALKSPAGDWLHRFSIVTVRANSAKRRKSQSRSSR
jgi:hypothetical protein